MARRDSGEPPTHLSAAPPSNGSAVAARPKPAPSAIRPAQPATALGQCPVCKAKLPPGATRDQLDASLKGHVLAEGQLMGRYGR